MNNRSEVPRATQKEKSEVVNKWCLMISDGKVRALPSELRLSAVLTEIKWWCNDISKQRGFDIQPVDFLREAHNSAELQLQSAKSIVDRHTRHLRFGALDSAKTRVSHAEDEAAGIFVLTCCYVMQKNSPWKTLSDSDVVFLHQPDLGKRFTAKDSTNSDHDIIAKTRVENWTWKELLEEIDKFIKYNTIKTNFYNVLSAGCNYWNLEVPKRENNGNQLWKKGLEFYSNPNVNADWDILHASEYLDHLEKYHDDRAYYRCTLEREGEYTDKIGSVLDWVDKQPQKLGDLIVEAEENSSALYVAVPRVS